MPWVKKEDCIKCKICVNVCPVEGAIKVDQEGYPEIDNDVCPRCGLCMEKCPKNAIRPNYENPLLRGRGRFRRGWGRGFGRGMGRGRRRFWER